MNRLPAWLRDAIWIPGYALLFHLAFQTAHLFWYLPAGVRFAALLLSPYRRWPWWIAVEVALFATGPYAALLSTDGVRTAAMIVSNPLLAAMGPWWLRRADWTGLAPSPASMTRMLVAFALAAIGGLAGNLFYPATDADGMSSSTVFLQIVLGDYIGILAVVPLAVLACERKIDATILRRWRMDVPCVLVPALTAYLVIVAHVSESRAFFLSAMLGFIPSLYFAVRSGWRGAALAVSATTFAVAYGGARTGDAAVTIEAQGLLAIAGSACLLLGAAYDLLERNRRELDHRNKRLTEAGARQRRLADELREAARRNLELSEHTRRWITAELHDEIGQNLTALQTRVRLLERKLQLPDDGVLPEINEALRRMRKTVSGLLSNLRPAGLDDLGLAFAFRDGAIRKLVEASGLSYEAVIDDPDDRSERLDTTMQTTLYRIAQEAANNTVRHARATRFRLRLRLRSCDAGTWILMILDDDGIGFDEHRSHTGIGLHGIRDRTLSIGGHLRLHAGEKGTQLAFRVRIPDPD